eukprot:scaffold11701_cov56-Phaeocystis_antarctica.AAC.3
MDVSSVFPRDFNRCHSHGDSHEHEEEGEKVNRYTDVLAEREGEMLQPLGDTDSSLASPASRGRSTRAVPPPLPPSTTTTATATAATTAAATAAAAAATWRSWCSAPVTTWGAPAWWSRSATSASCSIAGCTSAIRTRGAFPTSRS